MSKLPPTLQYAFVAATIGALLLGCCGFYSSTSLLVGPLAGAQSGGVDGSMGSFGTFHIATGIAVVLDLSAAIALGVGGALGLTGRPIGRTVTLIALGLAATSGVAALGLMMWITASMGDTFASFGPTSGEDARMMRMISLAGLMPSVCWLVMKLGALAAIASVLFSAETRAFYARVGPEGLAPGPRG